jgi:hypothetical protein
MIYRAGTAIGALPFFLRLTVTLRRDGADDHHGITSRLAGRQIVLPALRFVNSQTAAGADRLGVV